MKKTKLKWTKKLPTVDGFYWWRFNSKSVVISRVVVEEGLSITIKLSYAYKAKVWKGQWYGPIPSKEPK